MKRTVEISSQKYEFDTNWNGQKLSTKAFAMDTETDVVEDYAITPTLALASISAGEENYLIHPDKVADFIDLHADKHFIFQNVSFDFLVIDQHLIKTNRLETRKKWWDIVDQNRAHDTMILDMLVRLAEYDDYPDPRDLGSLASKYCKMGISKDDPYRMRYAELIGVNWHTNPESVEPGFIEYAIKDPIVTFYVFIKIYERAKEICRKAGISKETVNKFGVLTEAIQIKGAIALSSVTKNGMDIDLEYSKITYSRLKNVINETTKELLANPEYKDIFKFNKKTGLMEFTKHNNPKISLVNLRKTLEKVAHEIEQDTGLPVIIPKTEKGFISTSIKEWGDYKDKHPFLSMYHDLAEHTKLCQFFSALDKEVVHPRYTIMVRTGRTSCYSPNCFDGDTELLTNEGWIKFKEISSDLKVAQWDNGYISFVKPTSWIKTKTNKFIRLINEHIDLKVTPDHRCLLFNRKDNQLIVTPENYVPDRKQLHAGIYNNTNTEKFLLDDEIKLLIAIQADGHITQYGIDFKLCKKRKITRLLELINNLDLPYKHTTEGRNTRIYIYTNYLIDKLLTYIPTVKKLFGNWILKLPNIQLEIFREEIFLWDGLSTRKNTYGSTVKNNVDWIQIVNLLLNYRTLVSPRTCEYYDDWQTPNNDYFHDVYITNRNYSWTTNISRTIEDVDEYSYCVSVPSSFIVVRRNGKPCVTGNCQQIPKREGMREVFQAPKNKLLLAVDYSFVEMRTLAHVLELMYEKAVMADVIRDGKDLHIWCAAIFNNMSYDDFKKTKETNPDFFKKNRQDAKISNFGISGGLSANSLVYYAKTVYGVHITLEQANKFINTWKQQVFPEMNKYLTEDTMGILATNLCTSVEKCWRVLDFKSQRIALPICMPIRNIVEGKPYKKDGTPYSPEYIERVWLNLQSLNCNPALTQKLKAREAGEELKRMLFWSKVVTPTGRIRGRVSFTQAKNFPFQGLAADGAKISLWELIKKGYKLKGMIHDEILTEIDDLGGYGDYNTVKDIMDTMCKGMEQVTGKVPIKCDFVLNKKWTKDGKIRIEGNKVYPLS